MNLGAARQDFLYYHLALQSLVPRDADDVILLIHENDLPPADWGGLLSDAKQVLYRWSWAVVLLRDTKQRVIAWLSREEIEGLMPALRGDVGRLQEGYARVRPFLDEVQQRAWAMPLPVHRHVGLPRN